MLAYTVPRDPSACRVYVWRKLKKLGAVAVQDAVWVLPSTPHTLEQYRWLAAEIAEMDGEASVWEARQLLDGQDQALVNAFSALVEGPYRAILSALRKRKPDLSALSRQYQQTLALDYFRCAMGRKVRDALVAAEGGMER